MKNRAKSYTNRILNENNIFSYHLKTKVTAKYTIFE